MLVGDPLGSTVIQAYYQPIISRLDIVRQFADERFIVHRVAEMGQHRAPGAKALGFHQDDSYCDWVVPLGYVTVWIALDPTSAAGGTVEYARGSHKWGLFPPMGAFHAPDDYRKSVNEAAASVGAEVEIVPVEVPAGGCAIHAGGTWHGSGKNNGDTPRRAVVAH